MKKTWLIALVILALAGQGMMAAAGEATAPSKKAVKLIKKAEKAIKDKDFVKAGEFYQKVIETEPDCAEAYFGMGRLQLAQNQYEAGEKSLAKALELAPDHTGAAKLMARLYFSQAQQLQQQRKVDEANQLYAKLIALPKIVEVDRPHLAQSLYQLGVNLYTQKKFKESTETLKKFQQVPMVQTEYAPLFPASHYIIGLNLSQSKDFNSSNEYLAKYIEIRKDAKEDQLLPLAYFVLASNSFQGLDAEAAPIKADKKAKDRKEKLAELAAKYRKAIVPNLEKAIELKSDLEPAYVTLGNFYYYAKDLENTVSTYEKMIALFPNSPDKSRYESFLSDVKQEIENRAKITK